MDINVTKKQKEFIDATANEVLFGGAAGGGKSYAQLIDGLLFALSYPKSKQVAFRRTYPELEKSLIRASKEMFPRDVAEYNESKHVWTFRNGSIFEFASLPSESDKYNFQSAEYDIIRFDELTHFSEETYIYLISRCRGTNGYPKQIKSSTNPGGVGHAFVKSRFVDAGKWGEEHITENGTRQFIPAKVQDNKFLMESDPEYVKRLENLPEKEKKALLYGDWNIFDGQYFSEFDRENHVIEEFDVPSEWRRYTTIDYGMDMLAWYDIAIDFDGNVYVVNELYESGLIVSEAVAKIQEREPATIAARLAPPDLWNSQSQTGMSTAFLFSQNGMRLTRTNNDRKAGWLAIHELLKTTKQPDGSYRPKMQIFRRCVNLIRTLPLLQFDEKKIGDTAREPHEITHAPDSLRGFAIYWTHPAAKYAPVEEELTERQRRIRADITIEYENADEEIRGIMENRYEWLRG